jgi:hypothetical protein
VPASTPVNVCVPPSSSVNVPGEPGTLSVKLNPVPPAGVVLFTI